MDVVLPLVLVAGLVALLVSVFWALWPRTGSGGWQGMCVLVGLTTFVVAPSVVAAVAALGD